jgi:hypothetical protein
MSQRFSDFVTTLDRMDLPQTSLMFVKFTLDHIKWKHPNEECANLMIILIKSVF